MNFQGRLTDSSGVIMPNGLYNMQFRLFTVASGGSAVWTETRENNGTDYRVQVTNGLFSTKLGQSNPLSASLFASGALYFEITMATPATANCSTASCATWESPMTPRHQMSTSAYAYNAETLDGLDSSAFAAATGAAGYIQNGTSPQTADFAITGTGRIDTVLQAPSIQRTTNGTLLVGTTSTTTGLTVGSTSLTGTLAIDSGAASTISIGSSASARTINIGNVAAVQTVTLGSTTTTSATTIQGGATGSISLATGGTINLNSGTIATNATTANFLNTTATTVNAFGAGTAITIGANSGTATIRNSNVTVGNATTRGTFTNNGATLNATLALGNLAAGAIGTAATTVNIYTGVTISPTASGRTYTVPSPTTTTAGRTFYITNINGTNSFTVLGQTISPGTSVTLVWGGTAWSIAATPGLSGADTALSNIASTNLSAALNTTAGNLTLQTTTSGNIVLNPVGTVELQKNTNVTGTLAASTAVTTPSLDRANAGALSIGTTNATSITLAKDTTLAANQSLTITGGNTASRPGSPTEGMVYFDTTTKQLLTYANGKWQADGKDSIIVAANNSTDADKAAADYVADGNTGAANDGDQVEINSALTAADPAGSGRKTGKVVLLAGTYTIDAAISVPNNTTLAGVGQGTVITIPNSLGISLNAITNTTTAGNGSGIVIQDLLLDGNLANQTGGSVQTGIYFDGVGSGSTIPGGTIMNVTSKNWKNGYGIYLSSSSNNTIINNILRGNDEDGLYLLSSSNNTITGNTIQSNLTQGLLMSSSSYNNITGNKILDNSSRGIDASSFNSNNTITGNSINRNALGIIIGNNSQYNIVSGNTFQANSGLGISLNGGNNNTITSNSIFDSGGSSANNGISVSNSDSNALTGNKITDTSCSSTCYAISIATSTSDDTYLSDNTFSTTSGTATINDAGTGTIYAGQSTTQGGLDTRFKQTASTTAFQIQNASGAALLTADSNSTNNRIQIGSSSTDATAIFFMLDSYNNGTDPAGANGAMYYNTSLNKFRCYQNGGWADCLTVDTTGANTALSNLASTNISAALNRTSGNLTLQTTTSGNIILNPVGTVELQKNTNVTGTLAASSSVTAPSFDRAAAGLLAIGTTNATSINIGTNAAVAQTLTAGSTNTGATSTVQAGTSSIALANNSVNVQTGAASATAFTVKDEVGNSMITADTSAANGNLITNPGADVNTAGWSARTGTTMTQNTNLANVYYGKGSISAVNGAVANSGVNYPIQLAPSTAYTIFVSVKSTVSGDLILGYAANGVTETTYATTKTIGTNWATIQVDFTTPASVSGGAYVFVKQVSSTARTVYVDGLSATLASNGNYYQENQLNLGSSNTPVVVGVIPGSTVQPQSSLYVQQTLNNSRGMTVQGAVGADLFTRDIFAVNAGNGTNILRVNQNAGNYVDIQGGSTFWNRSALGVTTIEAGAIGLHIQGMASQTGDLFQLRNSSGNTLSKFNFNGDLTVGGTNSAASATALLVQDTGGSALLTVNTSTGTINVGSAATLISSTLQSTGILSVSSATTSAMIIDSGTTGPVVIGNGAYAKTITIGNTTGATTVNLQVGTGGLAIQSASGATSSFKPGTAYAFRVGEGGGSAYDTLNVDAAHGEVTIESAGTLASGYGQLRLANAAIGAYGTLLRMDDSTTYFLTTNANNQWGTYNALRPLSFSNSSGIVTIGEGLNVNGNVRLNMTSTATTNGVCHSGTSANVTALDRDLVVCNGTPNDYAEFYPTEQNVMAGELVATTPNMLSYQAKGADAETGIIKSMGTKKISILKKAKAGDTVLGIVSTAPYQTIGKDIPVSAHRMPIALNGRVPLKVTGENGAILAGDKLTISPTQAGFATKAVSAGNTYAVALEPMTNATGTIMVYVANNYYSPPLQNAVMNGSNAALGGLTVSGDINVMGDASFVNLDVAGDLTVSGDTLLIGTVTTGDIYINGHIMTRGDAPDIAVGAALGTSTPEATVDGTDSAGTIAVTAGSTNVTDGVLAKITFADAYAGEYKVVVSAQDENAATLRIYVARTAEGFVLKSLDPVAADTVYSFDYLVQGVAP